MPTLWPCHRLTLRISGDDNIVLGDGSIEILGNLVRISFEELDKLEKSIKWLKPYLKACNAYRQCLDDREAGKVKHCYYNGKRWRNYLTGAW